MTRYLREARIVCLVLLPAHLAAAGCSTLIGLEDVPPATDIHDAEIDVSNPKDGNLRDAFGNDGDNTVEDTSVDRDASDGAAQNERHGDAAPIGDGFSDSYVVSDASDGCVLNACGGCGPLSSAPNSACGVCGKYVCSADQKTVTCSDPGFNACGGCGTLTGAPNSSCGQCGKYVCNPEKTAVGCADPGPLAVQEVALGGAFTCVLLSSGGVRCWGDNRAGQLGRTGMSATGLPPVDTDVLTGAKSVTAGESYTCALLSSGGVRCWGSNSYGQLGNNSTTNLLTPPTADVLGGVTAIGAGYIHTCALLTSGGVRCWGSNLSGELGNNSTTDLLAPDTTDVLTGVIGLGVGWNYTCALRNTREILCWGEGDRGQLGYLPPDGLKSVSPQQVLVGQTAVAPGTLHTCAVSTNGGARCWGQNGDGQLGDGTLNSRSTPPSADVVTGVTQMAAGAYHTCGLFTSGGVRCWGSNYNGQIGDGTNTSRSTPSQDVVSGAKALFVGPTANHSCAVLNSGALRCWGLNNYGQLGDGTNSDRNLPVIPIATFCP